MPISELLVAGLELMLLGMGIVFGFLTVLVFTLRGMSALADWLDDSDHAPAAKPVAAATPAAPAAAPEDNTQLIAVISAAVKRYRAKNGS